ncbi:MAG: valine--tRNA ligase [Chloroflexi bacterium]|nr:valine--tRNA ligase [Chloroflexota bacterium]
MEKESITELPKTYNPHAVEKRLYDWWEKQGYFAPETQFDRGWASREQRPFVISMPPSNITGELHIGHALVMAIEDMMIRWHRMRGEPTLWLPGNDHASIGTHNVIEQALDRRTADDLLREIGYPLPDDDRPLTRYDLGREWFVRLGWAWKERYGGAINHQLRRLGASCDWTRERFTMDEGLSHAVRTAFVQLYHKGLIYRGYYMVNWCPRCLTAVSDLEVIHQEEATHLWHVRYPLLPPPQSWGGPRGGNEWPGAPPFIPPSFGGERGGAEWGSGHWAEGATEWIEVATTRPETILGDTAVAVNPDDERYAKMVGRTAVLPAIGRHIPIIADQTVDPDFGTGAVKVTPAHDPTDYEIGKRHGLEMPDVLNDDATMSELAGPYAGQDRYQCRRSMVADLEKEGLLVRIEPHQHALGHCQRCDRVIEPRLSTQWFVKIKPLAEAAIDAVRDGRITIIPERFDKVYFHWMENIRDWCISRQLYWGHRIPVWYCDDCDQLTVTPVLSVSEGMEDPTECQACGSPNIRQDPDILDTWFSSALWPFSTLGWPDDTEDLRYFYPTTILETGYDILFFWVARMIMMGLECAGDIPFRYVYLHGMVRDERGQKMSRSKHNVIDPLEVIDEYGTDALRFTLLTGSTPGNDVNLSLTRVEANRNFANKMWNAARFVLSQMTNDLGEQGSGIRDQGPGTRDQGPGSPCSLSLVPNPSNTYCSLPDRWILSRHNRLIHNVTRLMEDWQFGEAGRQIYDFLWGEYCDWFIEMCKIRLYGENEEARQAAQQVLVHVLDRTLRLLHPFMPFVTEEIWQYLKGSGIRDKGQGETSPPFMSRGAEEQRSKGELTPAPQHPITSAQKGGTEGEQWPEALIVAPWPEAGPTDEAAEAVMALIMEMVRAIRNARAEYQVEPGRRIEAIIAAGEEYELLTDQRDILVSLARLDADKLHIARTLEAKPTQALALVVGGVEIYLPLAGMVDLARERQRLTAEVEEVAQAIARSEQLLANEDFLNKAPAQVVEREREKLADYRQRQAKLREQLRSLT